MDKNSLRYKGQRTVCRISFFSAISSQIQQKQLKSVKNAEFRLIFFENEKKAFSVTQK